MKTWKRLLSLLLVLALLLPAVCALGEEEEDERKKKQDLYYAASDASVYTDSLISSLVRKLKHGRFDITLTEPNDDPLLELGVDPDYPYLYLSGKALKEQWEIPLEGLGLNEDGLFLQKGETTGLVPVNTLAYILAAAALGLQPEYLPTESELKMLTGMGQELMGYLMFIAPTPVQDSAGNTVIVIPVQDTCKKLVTALRIVLQNHEADLKEMLNRCDTNLRRLGIYDPDVSELISSLNSLSENLPEIPFNTITVTTFAEGKGISVVTDRDFFAAELTVNTGSDPMLACLTISLGGVKMVDLQTVVMQNSIAVTGTVAGQSVEAKLTVAGTRFDAMLTLNGKTLLNVTLGNDGIFSFTADFGQKIECVFIGGRDAERARFSVDGNDLFNIELNTAKAYLKGNIGSHIFDVSVDQAAGLALFDLNDPEIHAELKYSETGFELTAAAGDRKLTASGGVTNNALGITAALDGEEFLNIACRDVSTGSAPVTFAVKLPDLDMDGKLQVLEKGAELNAVINDQPLNISMFSLEFGGGYTATIGNQHFYGAWDTGRYGLHGRRGFGSLILSHNTRTLTANFEGGIINIRLTGCENLQFEAETTRHFSLRRPYGKFTLKYAQNGPMGKIWEVFDVEYSRTRFHAEERLEAITDGITQQYMSPIYLTIEDRTPTVDYDDPKMPEHSNITYVAWRENKSRPEALLFITDLLDGPSHHFNIFKTTVEQVNEDSENVPICNILVDMTNNKFPYDKDEAEPMDIEKLNRLFD